MYTTTFTCTYKTIVDEEVSNKTYQTEILKAFSMTTFSDELTKQIDQLHKTISYDFSSILNHVDFIYQDTEMLFMILFSYDFFDYTHELIKKIILKEDTTVEYNKLISVLKNIYE
jgi:hypothetical protein